MTEWFNSRSMCTWKQASGAARSHAPLLWGATVNYAKMKQSQRITCASSVNSVTVQYLRTACIPRGQDKSSAGALAAERRWPAHPSPRDRVHRCGAARSSTPRRTSCNTRMHASESRARPECLSCAALRQQQKHHLPEHGTVFLRHTPTHVRLCVPGWPPTLSLCRIQGWCGALHSF